ncbi:Hsp20 family protein [Govanella unica]|uniref:Hsp20 family protein n=1 Tax=Govanella unica TaxID=2975056 RepID=A0A9X3U1M4_9PROT|nr:Hsp20 family protein [Govania unica]MDA5194889.1 Hsp20 family protein [Govania unica]
MRSFDLSPLLRSTVGFDEINRLFETALRGDSSDTTYPPYNIEKVSDDTYHVSMAAAGFSPDELDITLQDGVLIISGKAKTEAEDKDRNYLYRGIARRAFERRFRLADTIKVVNASFENGLLNINLKREVPEHMKPRKIEITPVHQAETLPSQAA